jgi:putative transposase
MTGTLRRELLDRFVDRHERHLRAVLSEFLRHYNVARPHRALDQLAPEQAEALPGPRIDLAEHQIRRRRILDGVTSEYYVAA